MLISPGVGSGATAPVAGTTATITGTGYSPYPPGQPGAQSAGPAEAAPQAAPASQPDARLLRRSLAQLEPQGGKLMAHFLAALLIRHPEIRALFPFTLESHRQRLFDGLARYVRSCDHPETVMPWLAQLARDHRRFGVSERHYQPFRDTLLATLRAFSGPAWSEDLAGAWERALTYIFVVMADAIRECHDPAWALAEVAAHELRRPDLAVLTLRPEDGALAFQPGQHVCVQVARWPRIWREYSIANAPRADGLIQLHVRAVPGGRVSTVLVHQTRPGDSLILGPAQGAVTAGAISCGTVVCAAGGTGLAPVKAIVEDLARRPQAARPQIALLLGARHEDDLYDLPDLLCLQRSCPSLQITPVISDQPSYRGSRGRLPDVTGWHLPPGPSDVLISGPPAMVIRTVAVVASRAPAARLHFDPPPPEPSERDQPPAPGGSAGPRS